MLGLGRNLMWGCAYVLTLGSLCIEAAFDDGSSIKFHRLSLWGRCRHKKVLDLGSKL